MRTWLLLGCLVVYLLVVSTQGTSDFLKSRVTKELLEKLLQVKRTEKTPKTTSTLRERIGKVLHDVQDLRVDSRRTQKPSEKEEAMSKLVNLLKKKLNARQPGPGPMGPGPNPPKGRPDQRLGSHENEVLGRPVHEHVPEMNDPIGPPRKEGRSTESFEEPIYVMQGGELVPLNDNNELYKYLTLEMLTSRNFEAKPVTQDVVDLISSNLDDVGNKIIHAIELTVEALQSSEMTEENVVKVITEEFFGGFAQFGDELEEAVRDVVVALYRYVLYGTELNNHCEIGLDYFSFRDEQCHNVTNNYDRMDCIEEALYAFQYFMTDPFNSKWSDVTEEDIKAFEERRCNDTSTYFWETIFAGDINLDEFVDHLIVDFECIAGKLDTAIKDTGDAKRSLKRRNQGCLEPKEDEIVNSLEGLVNVVTEVMIDVGEVMVTLIVADPSGGVVDDELNGKRSLMMLLNHMAKRHLK